MMNLYPDYIKRWSVRACAAAIISLAGCSDDTDLFGNGSRPSDRLAFTTSLVQEKPSSVTRSTVSRLEIAEEEWDLQAMPGNGNGKAARGSLTNHLSGEAGVIGFQYDDETSKSPITDTGDNNVGFTFHGDELTSTSTTILWETIDKAHLDIYAYAPKEAAGLTVASASAPPVLSYKVPEEASGQKDILVSKWESPKDKNYKNETIHLTFDHALTAIRFKTGFECTVKSVKISGVYDSGTYDFSEGTWTCGSTTADYTVTFGEAGKACKKNDVLTDGENTLILMPQTLPDNAKIVLNCVVDGNTKELTAVIGGKTWGPGKLITYTVHKETAPETIYFDLALDDVKISQSSYSGKIRKNGTEVTVSGTHKAGNHYYVYQSTGTNRESVWSGEDFNTFTSPAYGEIKSPDGRPWREYITNNPDVNAVIKAWDIKDNEKIINKTGREGTKNRIDITGNVTCELTIDNIYSTYQNGASAPEVRTTAGITFTPTGSNAKVTVNMVGDNRLGAIHYYNPADNGNEIIFEGTGSLTVADVDGTMRAGNNNLDNPVGINADEGSGYWGNHWSSAIGGCDDGIHEQSYGIVFNSGIVFAGTTKAENCTAIGGGGNSYGKVTINGGTVTAVASTTGTAIGGGIGFNSQGGKGEVIITGGNVYAYNHANRWGIPSSAIGGAGSRGNFGETGTVTISGGYVYAESALGTAIGGGSSYTQRGGAAVVTITGGEVFAKTGSEISASIGGGTAYTQGNGKTTGTSSKFSGGNATVTIKGNPIIRTGSVGGGGTGDINGSIGNATIHISGGDTQAQFILAAGTGSGQIPSFTMDGGIIRNSDTEDKEYLHVKRKGGAVYLENGKITMKSGTIRNCTAKEGGGAIYIEGTSDGNSKASFTMHGGTIQDNESETDGGGIYIIDGAVTIDGGVIDDNLAAGGNGGGIFIRRGSLTVSEANGIKPKIQNNAAEIRKQGNSYTGGNGGGIYVFSQQAMSDVTVNLASGTITQNTADRKGGGVCVDMGNSNNSADVTIGIKNGGKESIRIIENHSLLGGGGLYARGTNAHVTINSGTIMNNSVSQYVYNQNVANEGGEVTLNGGEVTHNVVTFHANDGTEKTERQNIVTSTNSKLAVPSFDRTGYKLVGWNTKANGKGVRYKDGQTMNINADIDLYAQWEIAVTQ